MRNEAQYKGEGRQAFLCPLSKGENLKEGRFVIIALREGVSVEEGPEEASLEAQGGLLQGCCRTPGSKGCPPELGAALGKAVCGQTLMSPWAEDPANPPQPGRALTRVREASSLQSMVSCRFSAVIALDNGSRRTQSHTKRISSLRVASGYSPPHPPNWLR